MAQIKIFRSESYTQDIIEIREKLNVLPETIKNEIKSNKYLPDYVDKVWKNSHSLHELYKSLILALKNHEIILYHNTRQPDKTSLLMNGLIFSNEKYICFIKDSLRNEGYNKAIIDFVVNKVQRQINKFYQNESNHRRDQICFIYDVDYHNEYDKFYSTFGGEFLERALDKSESIYRDVLRIGYPYIVEFSIPVALMDKYLISNIAKYMLEEWLHLDIRKDMPDHRYDGWMNKQVPSENILNVYEISEIDDIRI